MLAGALGLMRRARLALPDSAVLSLRLDNQVFTMHGTVLSFLFAVPVVEGDGDETCFDWPFFIAAHGGDALLWRHLFWFLHTRRSTSSCCPLPGGCR